MDQEGLDIKLFNFEKYYAKKAQTIVLKTFDLS